MDELVGDDRSPEELVKAAAWVLSRDDEALAEIVRRLVAARVISVQELRQALRALP